MKPENNFSILIASRQKSLFYLTYLFQVAADWDAPVRVLDVFEIKAANPNAKSFSYQS